MLCDKNVSPTTTTSLRAHLQAKHSYFVLKELRVDETLEVRKIAALATMKEDYGSVERYTGLFQVGLDEAFVE